MQLLKELADEGGRGWVGCALELGGLCEGSQIGMDDDVNDSLRRGCGGRNAWQIDRGNLESVEQEAGAPRVELVRGEAVEDLADCGLDGAAVLRGGKGKGGAAVIALREILRRRSLPDAGGVVVIAEVLLAKARAATTVAVGVDVTALKAARAGRAGCGGHRCGYPPGGTFCKVFQVKSLGLDRGRVDGAGSMRRLEVLPRNKESLAS